MLVFLVDTALEAQPEKHIGPKEVKLPESPADLASIITLRMMRQPTSESSVAPASINVVRLRGGKRT